MSPGLFVHQWNVRLREMPDVLYVSFPAYEQFQVLKFYRMSALDQLCMESSSCS